MKSIKTFGLIGGIVLLSSSLSFGQTEKKMHIVLNNNVNGVEVKLDTIVILKDGDDHHSIMKELDEKMGLNGDDLINLDIKGNDGNLFIIDGKGDNTWTTDELGKGAITVDVEDNGDEKTIIIKSDKGEKRIVVPSSTDESEIIKKYVGKEKGSVRSKSTSVNVEDNGSEKTITISGPEGENVFVIPSGADESKILRKFSPEGGKGQIRILSEDHAQAGDHNIFVRIEMDEVDENDFKDAKVKPQTYRSEISGLKIFPNPSTGMFTLELETSEKHRTFVKVFSLDGKEVFKASFGKSSGTEKMYLNLSDEEKGIYLLQIEQGNSGTSKKLIVQ